MSIPTDGLLEVIAREELNVPTFIPRGNDALDFHNVGVVALGRALAEPMPPE